MVSKKEMQKDINELYRRISEVVVKQYEDEKLLKSKVGERHEHDSVRTVGQTANGALRRVQTLETRVAELGAQLLTHHEVVLVNDVGYPKGQRILDKLSIYKGKTPQGQRIHAVRSPFGRATEYHIAGKGYTDEEFNRGE